LVHKFEQRRGIHNLNLPPEAAATVKTPMTISTPTAM
jgi:hypothetical protein